MAASLWVGQFNIVRGETREEGPLVGSFPGKSQNGERPHLYVVAEPVPAGGDQLCGQLVAALGHLFERYDLSLTATILRALRTAHDQLQDWNRRTLHQEKL